ncbi:MAG: transcriptional repressor NrdR [Actinobacteria bacterium]|nr:transcriptional repressor NrdR [Actinomycetota bacterium]
MVCPACGHPTKTLETRRSEGGAAVRRRRSCPGCGERFTTFERREALTVRKRGGRRQPFDRAKLLAGLVRACHKRDVDPRELEAIVAEVERQGRRDGGEIGAERIGLLCLQGLETLDRGAFLQFAGTLPEPIPADLENPRNYGASEGAVSVRSEEDAARSIPTGAKERARGDS